MVTLGHLRCALGAQYVLRTTARGCSTPSAHADARSEVRSNGDARSDGVVPRRAVVPGGRSPRLYVSKLFLSFGRSEPHDKLACKSQKLMLQNDVMDICHSGAYHLLPLGQRALEKLIRLIDWEMSTVGGQKISMVTIAPADMWRKTGRWESTGKEMFKLQDRHGMEFCLGPTHEELVTSIFASRCPLSYRRLPILLYQISRKFRDEIQPKHGLLRAREFEMKDMYSFHTDEASAMETYHSLCEAYSRIFDRLSVPYVKVRGSTGNIGGSLSHEFHYLAPVGEDKLLLCSHCGVQVNKEMADSVEKDCLNSGHDCQLQEVSGTEVGHCFYLGTKYSSVFNALFEMQLARSSELTHMGCFGLGVTRILQAGLEVLSSDSHLRWPSLLAPYQVCIIPQKEGFEAEIYAELADDLSDQLTQLPALHGEVVIDDRTQLSIGHRVYDALQIGYPYIVILGKKARGNPCIVEVQNTISGERNFLSRDQLWDLMSSVVTL
ncbi:hypothetical protein C0Q70_17228 [Pomacea canaliculata]|uniref:Probable proline--tRNA ligase, mitochondrial n=1 Tax=Pomacea canaliculata TaxID=400727 RepID=A0A2T7NS26_POMCA|nr:hypothetical protein C0Q70_17228 [Pomacea canaliculata]